MKNLMSVLKLEIENLLHKGTGGRSQENSGLGFRAAFFDFDTCTIYLSRFADGRIAPMHLMDGLPNEVVVDRSSATGRVLSAKASLISGFERNGYFYTRASAVRAIRDWDAGYSAP